MPAICHSYPQKLSTLSVHNVQTRKTQCLGTFCIIDANGGRRDSKAGNGVRQRRIVRKVAAEPLRQALVALKCRYQRDLKTIMRRYWHNTCNYLMRAPFKITMASNKENSTRSVRADTQVNGEERHAGSSSPRFTLMMGMSLASCWLMAGDQPS